LCCHFIQDRLSWLIFVFTLALIWFVSKEERPYSKVYHRNRFDGAFSTEYSNSFQRYLQEVEAETRTRLNLGPISPIDDLHRQQYHPELSENWQRAIYPNRVSFRLRQIVAWIFLGLVALAFADTVSRLLTKGHGVFYGFLTTGLSLRQIYCRWVSRSLLLRRRGGS
jgi:hypothetical protein